MLLNSLNKSERLKSSRLIGEVLSSGDFLTIVPFKFFWVVHPDSGHRYPAQIAISVPSRYFKRAVDRNLIKRRIREAYRTNKQELYKYLSENNLHLIFVILYLPKIIYTFRQIEDSMKEILGMFIDQLKHQDTLKSKVKK